MNNSGKTVVRIAIIVIGITMLTLGDNVDYTFIDAPYKKYVREYVKTLEDNGVNVPCQQRWTVRSEPSLFGTTTIGFAKGMFDDREVMVFLTPLLKFQKEDIIRFVIWHELTHDIFNLRHGTTLLMKPTSYGNDDKLFPSAKALLIKYLKAKQKNK